MKSNDASFARAHNDEPRPRTMFLREESRGVVRLVKPADVMFSDKKFSGQRVHKDNRKAKFCYAQFKEFNLRYEQSHEYLCIILHGLENNNSYFDIN